MRRVKNFTPIAIAAVAAFLGTAGNMDCETVAFPQIEGSGGDAVLLVGPQSYRTFSDNGQDEVVVYRLCNNYATLTNEFGFEHEVDARSKTVVAFSIITAALAGMTIFYFLSPCVKNTDFEWARMRDVFVILCLFQGLTLLILSSSICLDNPVLQYLEAEKPSVRETFQDTCEPALGFKLIVTSVVLWFAAALSTFIVSPTIQVRSRIAGANVDYQSEGENDDEENNNQQQQDDLESRVEEQANKVQEEPLATPSGKREDRKTIKEETLE